MLARERCNVTESRVNAAAFEIQEETRIIATLMPITLRSRAQPEIEEDCYTEDAIRTFEEVIELFMLTRRYTSPIEIKLIWWFIGIVDEVQPQGLMPEPGLTPAPVTFGEAVAALNNDCDKEVLQMAIQIFIENYHIKK